MTVSINRKGTDLFDSIEDSSYLDSCLKPECNSTPTESEDEKETRSDMKINGWCKYDDGSCSLPESEPFEEGIFDGVKRWDRICAQSGQVHNIKQQFKGVKTSIERIPELFSLRKSTTEISTENRRYGTNYIQALKCRHCGATVIVEVTTKIYNLKTCVEDEKVEHGHPIDPDTICEALERVSTEVRLLDKWDPDDYDYLVRRGETVN